MEDLKKELQELKRMRAELQEMSPGALSVSSLVAILGPLAEAARPLLENALTGMLSRSDSLLDLNNEIQEQKEELARLEETRRDAILGALADDRLLRNKIRVLFEQDTDQIVVSHADVDRLAETKAREILRQEREEERAARASAEAEEARLARIVRRVLAEDGRFQREVIQPLEQMEAQEAVDNGS